MLSVVFVPVSIKLTENGIHITGLSRTQRYSVLPSDAIPCQKESKFSWPLVGRRATESEGNVVLFL